jgi:hypothetical protein
MTVAAVAPTSRAAIVVETTILRVRFLDGGCDRAMKPRIYVMSPKNVGDDALSVER